MLAEPERYRAPPEANVPSMEGFNTNVGFKTTNISFLSSNVTWFSHLSWLLQTTKRIQCGSFFDIFMNYLCFFIFEIPLYVSDLSFTFWSIFIIIMIVPCHLDIIQMLCLYDFFLSFSLCGFFFNIRDSGSNFNIVEFISLSYHDLHFLLIMIYIFDEPGA